MSAEDSLLALAVLYVLGFIGGYGLNWLKNRFSRSGSHDQTWGPEIPPLLGMLLFGFLAANFLPSTVAGLSPQWSVYVRNLAQCFILMRGGMSLNLSNLKTMKGPLLLLSFLPQLTDALTVAVICVYASGLPVTLAIATGFMLSAVSPAIVVPICIRLKENGYGTSKNIQEFLICVTSIDNVVALVMFGIFSAIGLETISVGAVWFGYSTFAAVLCAVFVVVGGLLLGVVTGVALSALRPLHWIVYFLCLLVLSLGYVFIALAYSMSGLAYIAVLLTCIISVRSRKPEEQKLAASSMLAGWKALEVILFALIGAAIDPQRIDSRMAILAVVLTLAGIGAKIPAAYFFFRGNLTPSERLHCTLCRLPKATIQASLGGVVLAIATTARSDEFVYYGNQILTAAALSIVLTAPLAAVISTCAPKLLVKEKSLQGLKEETEASPLVEMRDSYPGRKLLKQD